MALPAMLRVQADACLITERTRNAPRGNDTKRYRDFYFAGGHAFGLRQAAHLIEEALGMCGTPDPLVMRLVASKKLDAL